LFFIFFLAAEKLSTITFVQAGLRPSLSDEQTNICCFATARMKLYYETATRAAKRFKPPHLCVSP